MRYWQSKYGTLVERIIRGWSNVYLVSFNEHRILVDTGPSAMSGLLLKRLSMQEISKIDALVLTHTHFDHIGSAAVLKEKFGMPVIVHRSEAAYLEAGLSPLPHGSTPPTKFIYYLGAPRVEHLFRVRGVTADFLVDECFDLSIFGVNARLVHTPGHSKGSCSMIIDDQIAISGDTCVSLIPGRAFPPWADDPNTLVNSWKILLETGCELFIPMHHWTISRKILEKEYEKYKKRDVHT